MILTILRILYLRLRNNWIELLLVFVMPVLFFSIFALIFSNGIATGVDKKLRIGWISREKTKLGNELLEFLKGNSSLEISLLTNSEIAQPLDSAEIATLIEESQKTSRFDLIVKLPEVIPQGEMPELSRVSLVTDGQNPLAVGMVTSVVKGFISQKKAQLAAAKLMRFRPEFVVSENVHPLRPPHHTGDESTEPGTDGDRVFFPPRDAAEVFSSADQESLLTPDQIRVSPANELSVIGDPNLLERDSPRAPVDSVIAGNTTSDVPAAEIDQVIITLENPQAERHENPRIAMYAAGIAVLFLLFSATGHGAALLEEAESGTLDRILVSRASLMHVVVGKWLGIFLLGCVQITVMFLWAELIFRIQLRSHLAGFCVMTASTSAATSSFAMLLATLCRSRAQLNAAAVVIILCMSAMGGSMIPRFAMSERMKEIGKWTFNAWALDGYQKVFWYQSPMSDLKPEVCVLVGSAAGMMLVTLLLSGRWKRG